MFKRKMPVAKSVDLSSPSLCLSLSLFLREIGVGDEGENQDAVGSNNRVSAKMKKQLF